MKFGYLLFFLSLAHVGPLFCDVQTVSSQAIKKTPKKGIDIQRAMDYPIPAILERYKKDYGVSDELAKVHERELKRFLIMCAENYPKGTEMLSAEIDDLWHTFLLFTKDYKKYCDECLGHFVDHVPKTHENK